MYVLWWRVGGNDPPPQTYVAVKSERRSWEKGIEKKKTRNNPVVFAETEQYVLTLMWQLWIFVNHQPSLLRWRSVYHIDSLWFFKVDLGKAFLHLPWAALGPPWLGCWPPLALPCVSGPLVPGHLGLGPAPRGRKNQCQLLKYSRQQSNFKTTAIKINDSSNY